MYNLNTMQFSLAVFHCRDLYLLIIIRNTVYVFKIEGIVHLFIHLNIIFIFFIPPSNTRGEFLKVAFVHTIVTIRPA